MSSRFNVAKRLFWRSLILLLWIGVARETTSLLFGQTPFSKPDSAALSSVVSSTAPRSFHPGLMRVDMSITTPKPTNWIGEITLSRGSFTDLVPLGFNATSGSDFFFSNSSQNSLTLYTRSPETFCGVETTIIAPRDSQLELRLLDATNNRKYSKTVFIERLIDSSTSIALDEQGSVVEITRAPADELPVYVRRFGENDQPYSNAIFRPNETVSLTVVPRSSSSKLANDLTLVASARILGTDAPFWNESRETPLSQIQQNDLAASDPNGKFNPCVFNMTTPDKSGVFEISFELFSKTPNTPSRLSLPLPQSRKTRQEGTLIARRVVQGIVVSNTSNQTETINSLKDVDGNLRGELLATIDPTNPSWRKAFSKRHSLPFYKSTTGEVPRSEKNGGVFRSTFADDVGVSKETFAGDDSAENIDDLVKFRQIAPVDAASPPRSNAPSTGLVLGQAPTVGSNGSAPFNMNFFGLGKTDQSKEEAEMAEARERYDFVRRWERDKFNSFLRNLDRRNWTVVDDLWEKPLGSGSSRPFASDELKQFAPPRANFARLEPNGSTGEQNEKNIALEKLEALGVRYAPVSWEAYPVPIQEPGKPHLLEIEYPTSFPQKLAVSILEQGVSGALLPTSQDFGIVVDDNPLSDRASKEVSRFSMVFWPRTKTPVVLLSNASSQTPAAYGQIRVYRANDAEPRIATPNRGRIFSLAFTNPDVCRQFSGALKPSFFGLSGVEDWQAFDDSISRLLYYLSAYNYDAATLAVVADGSSLYPSRLINPTPKFDGGVFLPTGGDQHRKDVLTLAAARFETQGKSIIPLVKLNGTLPNLELRLLQLRSGMLPDAEREALEGVEWIGADSRRLIDSRRADDGSGPYYNVLHPEVEKQVLAIVQELVARCAPYDSFGGLALDVGADGWLALPDDVFYGMDDVTIARFVRESNLMNVLADKTNDVQNLLLAKGPERYRKRAEFINSNCRNEWLEWRVDALFNFYSKIYATIASARSDVRLFLVASGALDGPNCQKALIPKLDGTSKLRDSLRLVGLDPTRYASFESQSSNAGGISQTGFVAGAPTGESWRSAIVLLRPEKVAQTKPFVKSALDLELKTPEALSLFSKDYAFPGVSFLHEPDTKRLYDFDLTSPFPASVVELNTRALPAGFENRGRFARSLALADCLCFFDGGDSVPIGQEEALRDWVYVFKSLPAVPFKTWRPKTDPSGKSSTESKEQTSSEETSETSEKIIQPVVARYYRNNRETWIYLLNAAPFHTNVKLTLSRKNKSRYEVFAGLRREEPIAVSDSIVWNFTATPYDLVALRVDDPKASIESLDVTRPAEICGDDGRMRQTVQAFVDRVVAARKGLRQPIRNGGFEESFAPVVQTEAIEEKTPEKANILGLMTPQSLLFKKTRDSEDGSANDASNPSGVLTTPEEPDMTQVPGWRVFGPNDVDARLDINVVKDGRASLRLSSRQSAGGIVSQPFATPTSGRLWVQISVGVAPNASELPLEVCLTGRKNGEPYVRRLTIGDTFLKKIQKQKAQQVDSGIVWHTDVILFDQLPLDGLENLSLCFELIGPGEVWLDQIQLYRLAFATSEQTELMKLINMTEYRASKGRVVEVMFTLDGYWPELLRDQLPDDSPLLSSVRRQTELVAEIPQETSAAKTDSEEKKDEKENKGWSRFKFW